MGKIEQSVGWNICEILYISVFKGDINFVTFSVELCKPDILNVDGEGVLTTQNHASCGYNALNRPSTNLRPISSASKMSPHTRCKRGNRIRTLSMFRRSSNSLPPSFSLIAHDIVCSINHEQAKKTPRTKASMKMKWFAGHCHSRVFLRLLTLQTYRSAAIKSHGMLCRGDLQIVLPNLFGRTILHVEQWFDEFISWIHSYG